MSSLLKTIEDISMTIGVGTALVVGSSSILPPESPPINLYPAPLAGAVYPNSLHGCEDPTLGVRVMLDTLEGKNINSKKRVTVLVPEGMFRKFATGQYWEDDFDKEILKGEICDPNGPKFTSELPKSKSYARLVIGDANPTSNLKGKDRPKNPTSVFVKDLKNDGMLAYEVDLEELIKASNNPQSRIDVALGAKQIQERWFPGLVNDSKPSDSQR